MLEDLRALRDRCSDSDPAGMADAEGVLAFGGAMYPTEVIDALIAGDSPIAAWRHYHGWNQEAFADRIGITHEALERLETVGDGHPHPEARHALRRSIAGALRIPVSILDAAGIERV